MQLVDSSSALAVSYCNYPAASFVLDSGAATDPAIVLLSCPTVSAVPHLWGWYVRVDWDIYPRKLYQVNIELVLIPSC